MQYTNHHIGVGILALALLAGCSGAGSTPPSSNDIATSPQSVLTARTDQQAAGTSLSSCSVSAVANPSPSTALIEGISPIGLNDTWLSVLQQTDGAFGTLYVERYPAGGTKTMLQPFSQSINYASMKALSDSDIWVAADAISGGNQAGAVIAHWNGSVWSTIPVTGQDASTFFVRSVTGLSTNDVWFSGNVEIGTSKGIVVHLALAHWNGHALSVVAVAPYVLYAQVALEISPTNVVTITSSDDTGHAVAARWNGSSFNFHDLPVIPGQTDTSTMPTQIAATSANNIWVVGYHATASSIVGRIWRYNGSWNPYVYTGAIQSFSGVAPLDATRTVVTGIMPNASKTTTEAYTGTDRFAPIANNIPSAPAGPSAMVPGTSLFWVPTTTQTGYVATLMSCH